MYEPAYHTNPVTLLTDPQLNARTFNAANGDVLFEPGAAAENVYFVRRGQVRLYKVGPDGSSRLIEILGPGQWCGTAALAGQANYQKRAVVVGPSVISEIRIERLLAALVSQPNQLVELMRQVAGKLLAAHDDAAKLVFSDCNQRLIDALLRFSRSAASTQREDGVVLRITHDQLAQAVGVARETVSLALTQLRQQNLLQTGRNQLVFNPDSLRRAVLQSRPNGAREASAPRENSERREVQAV